MAYPFAPISITAAITADRDIHANGPVLLFAVAAGATVTLPASTGSGDRYRFHVHTTITSNSAKIQVANSTDVMQGVVVSATDGASNLVVAYETASTSDTITLNGTTTGGVKGDYIELEDVATGFWRVLGHTSSTGTVATPFSAAV